MKQLTHTMLTLLFICLLTSAFAQDETKEDEKSESKNTRTNGLKRISPPRHWDVDEEATEVNVEKAVERAMRSVEVALEKMEIHLSSLNLNQVTVPPVHVHIPHIAVEPIEVNIPPINVDIPAIDMNINHHMRHFGNRDEDGDHNHRSNKNDDEKTKGLKKIN